MFLFYVISFRDFVYPDVVKISQVRCPCCLNTLMSKYQTSAPVVDCMDSCGYENAHCGIIAHGFMRTVLKYTLWGHWVWKHSLPYEPRCEKTGLRDFRPGPTQTGLHSFRRRLES